MYRDNDIRIQLTELNTSLSKRVADIKITVHETLVQRGDASPYISKSKAYRTYGRGTVDNWIKWGLLPEIKDGDTTCNIRLEVSRLIALSEKCSRCEFYEHNRKITP